MRRVFVQSLETSLLQLAVDTPWEVGDSYTAQEDLIIVALEGHIHVYMESDNDGVGESSMEVTMDGTVRKQKLMKLSSGEGWEATGARGFEYAGDKVIVFPDGMGISMREGETIYLLKDGRGKSAGTTSFSIHASVFYVKGRTV